MAEETTETQPITDKSAYQAYAEARRAGQTIAEATAASADDDPPSEEETPTPPAETQDSPPVATDDEDDGDDDARAQKRRQRTENRFKRLNDRTRQLERDNAELRGELKAMREMQQAASSNSSTASNSRPTREQFDDEDAYLEAVVDWKLEQTTAAPADSPSAQKPSESAQTDQSAAIQQRFEDARERHDDYDEVLADSEVLVNDDVSQVLLLHQQGPELLYYLAQHPDEAEALNEVRPEILGRRVQRLASRLDKPPDATESPPPPDKQSPAPSSPEPINPVSGGSTGRVERNMGELSYQDYAARRRKEQAARRG